MKKQKGYLIPELLIVIFFLAGFAGWVMNIVKLWNAGFDVITGYMIVRIIGVFLAPLGAVVGYF